MTDSEMLRLMAEVVICKNGYRIHDIDTILYAEKNLPYTNSTSIVRETADFDINDSIDDEVYSWLCLIVAEELEN